MASKMESDTGTKGQDPSSSAQRERKQKRMLPAIRERVLSKLIRGRVRPGIGTPPLKKFGVQTLMVEVSRMNRNLEGGMVFAGKVSWKTSRWETASCLMLFKSETIVEVIVCKSLKHIGNTSDVVLIPNAVVRRHRKPPLTADLSDLAKKKKLAQSKSERTDRKQLSSVKRRGDKEASLLDHSPNKRYRSSAPRGPTSSWDSSATSQPGTEGSSHIREVSGQTSFGSTSSGATPTGDDGHDKKASQLRDILSKLKGVTNEHLEQMPSLRTSLLAAAAAIDSAMDSSTEDSRKRDALTYRELPVPKVAVRDSNRDLETPDPVRMPRFRPPADAHNEMSRLRCLRKFNLVDTKPEEVFDNIIWLAVRICDSDCGAMNLVEKERLFFKAAIGTGDVRESPRQISFCSHTILYPGNLLMVSDATKDDRFADCPMVTGANVKFYAGIPVEIPDEDGEMCCIGTICVWGSSPKTLNEFQQAALLHLGKIARRAIVLGEKNLEEYGFKEMDSSQANLIKSWTNPMDTDTSSKA